MMQVRVTMQVADGPEIVVFGDEVSSQQLYPTLNVAESAVRGALAVLRTGAVIREYIGTHVVKSVKASRVL